MTQQGEVEVGVGCIPVASANLALIQKQRLAQVLDCWAEATRERGLAPWLVFMPCKGRALQGHLRFAEDAERPMDNVPLDLPELVGALCARRGIGYINLTPTFTKASDAGILTFNPADVHLNKVGSRLVAETVAAELRDHSEGP